MRAWIRSFILLLTAETSIFILRTTASTLMRTGSPLLPSTVERYTFWRGSAARGRHRFQRIFGYQWRHGHCYGKSGRRFWIGLGLRFLYQRRHRGCPWPTMDWAEADDSNDSGQVTMNLQFASLRARMRRSSLPIRKNRVIFAYDPDKDEAASKTRIRSYQGAIISCEALEVGRPTSCILAEM